MIDDKMIKLMANIESQTGLEAFKLYMEYNWAKYWMDVVVNGAGVLFFLSIVGGVGYLIWRDARSGHA